MITPIGKHYLYRHIRLDTGEPFYIGIGTKNNRNHITISNEYYRAHSKSDRSCFWKKVTNKTPYEVEILLESDDYELLKQKEKEFITLYGRRDLGKGSLVNLTDGGDGAVNIQVSLETRQKISNSNKGVKLSEEALYNIRKSAKNKIAREALEKEGSTFITNQGYKIKIIKYNSCKDCTIQFEDGTIRYNIAYREIIRGEVDNFNHKSVYGIGYTGYGNYEAKRGSQCHLLWLRLIKESIEEGVIFYEEWANFQNFAKWFEENHVDNFRVNKTLLQKEDKIYSPETCYFVPDVINTFKLNNEGKKEIPSCIRRYPNNFRVKFNGKHIGMFSTIEEALKALKTVKELYVKKIAEEYKDKININVYNKLINYEFNMQ